MTNNQDLLRECRGYINSIARQYGPECRHLYYKEAAELLTRLDAALAEPEKEEAVAWPPSSLTNFDDDLYNAIPEPPMQAGTVCPMCGDAKPHAHTAREVIIFRNGEKRGRSIGR